jgi:2-polyprenyl-3-methyl-5-hydroxy-6-metoxy-1,4-benzoquinol methylase
MSQGEFQPREYWESRLRANPNIHGVGYISLGEAYNSWMYKVRARVFDSAVKQLGLDLTRARVLDAGSGTGFYLDRWLRLGARDVQGADLTETATGLLRSRFPQLVVHTVDMGSTDALDALGVRPGSFDAVSCMDVLFHIVDDARYETALRNVATLLRPGGFFVLSDNCVHGAEIRLEHHVSRSLEHVIAALGRAGLELVQRRPMLYLMNSPVDAPPARRARWERLLGRATAREWQGWITGAVLYPLERWLVARRQESPTTELLVCRRVP